MLRNCKFLRAAPWNLQFRGCMLSPVATSQQLTKHLAVRNLQFRNTILSLIASSYPATFSKYFWLPSVVFHGVILATLSSAVGAMGSGGEPLCGTCSSAVLCCRLWRRHNNLQNTPPCVTCSSVIPCCRLWRAYPVIFLSVFLVTSCNISWNHRCYACLCRQAGSVLRLELWGSIVHTIRFYSLLFFG